MNALARTIDGAVLVTAHLSQAGIRSEGGHSGSTDWSNGARGRLYLGRLAKENGDNEPPDPHARLLTRKKANYASIGDMVKLHWARGVFLPDDFASSPFRRPADDVFLALLTAHEGANRPPLSESKKAQNYAPRVRKGAGKRTRRLRRERLRESNGTVIQRQQDRQRRLRPKGR